MAGSVVAKVLKAVGWTLVGLVVAVSVMLLCAVKFLDSKYLAPMIERMANDYIDGDVKVADLRLAFNPHFPILGIELDSLSVISHAFDSLTNEQRGLLPNYADSLLTLDHMSGAIDIKRLFLDNELSLHDVALSGLSVNLVIAHNGRPNYDVMKHPADNADSSSSKGKMPGFRINRFSLSDPKEIRFYNAADSTSASVLLLTDAAVDGEKQPTYRLKINGNVTSPKATLMTNLDEITFGLNGKVFWDPVHPGLVAMDEMELRGAFIRAVVSGEIDLTESPIARRATVDLSPIAISDLISLLPDSIRRQHRLYPPYFITDMAVGGRFELTKPMNLATDTLPSAKINVSIAPSILDYGNAHLKDIALDLLVNTVTNLPDLTTIDLSRFTVAGPGTDLKAWATIATPLSDPAFDTNIKGRIDIRDLPPILLEKIPGYLAGIITADIKAKGSTSMLKPEKFHHIVADGTVTAKDVYFLTADTTKLVEAGTARIELDSKRIVDGLPLLNLKVDVDTTTVLVSGIDLAFGAVSLTAGVNDKAASDTTVMRPVAANLKVGRFNITSITDSAGARIRDISGPVALKPVKGRGSVPQISTDLLIGHVSAGTLSDRFLIDATKVKASLLKEKSLPKSKDSSHKKARTPREYSYISPAEVHKYVYYKRTHRRHHTKRVYTAEGWDEDEMLVWNLTPQFQRFLNEWKLQGTVNTNSAHLLSPVFPLKNHISTLALKFSNDSVNISNISMRAGASDITMSGLISNVRRALTAKTDNDLKGNLSLMSDTIDINELSASVFTGASYASDRRHGKARIKAKDDRSLADKLDALSKAGPGRSAPVLIPVNIDANLRIAANRLLYSDVDMQNMAADLLVYDGGVNLHDLKADSEAGNLELSALYTAPNPHDMHFGFGMRLSDFNIAKFVKMVPAIDSITPLMHDFSGMVGANIAATCRIDSGMNIDLPSLNAAIRITGDNLAFIDPEKYRTLGKWLGFKNKSDNTIHSLNVEMTVEDGLMRVYPFAFNIDRYRLGIYGSNNLAMDFNYHLAVLKSPIPFKFGITVSGNPKKYKVRFGGAKFKENSIVESVDVVNNARINLIDQIEGVFRRGVRNSRFAKLKVARPAGFESMADQELSAADSLRLIQEGLLEAPKAGKTKATEKKKEKRKKKKRFWIF